MGSKNKRLALVTGASSGIGEALCRRLVASGYRCIAIARRGEELQRLQEEVGGPNSLLYFPCDVALPEQVNRVSSELRERGEIPRLFFLNAGATGESALDPTGGSSVQHHRWMFDVNYFGVMNWVAEWEKPCLECGGATFLVTSSLNAIFAPPVAVAYAASKAAIAKAFEGLDLHWSSLGLRFLISYPGPVATSGLVGKLPFTRSADRMAGSLLTQTEKGKARKEPSWFYSTTSRLLRLLPYRVTRRLLRIE